ncbi:MAG: hypothetical protein H6750_17765 [Nitrospiraceae bacterium]|nr:hypothetical protein [Nitrospira sp.]MCA9457494.1 hypothetical protein [Nitrospira sp.]MCB9776155.1 hypothetical protein [Nitrospiraceae bacterium]MCW5784908.1 hypothetical protein [Nitrospirales bacterium]
MKRSLPTGIQGVLLAGLWVCVGCGSPHAPLDLNSFDPSQDQQFIADQYRRQAALMKQTAEDLKSKAERYAQLFGADSEWATSAKLLEKFYEQEAQNRERLAILHAEAGRLHPHSPHFETR